MQRPVDLREVERVSPQLAAVERRFAALSEQLRRARVVLAAGEVPELEAAAHELEALCRELGTLPAEEVRLLEPRLLALVHDVRELFTSTGRALRETGEELGRGLRHAEAARAYARSGGSGR